jgi:adenosylmethionine-8-amino-7-oxononanoate aminotransferase
VSEPFASGAVTYQHGLTYSGHPLSTAVASAALDVYEREGVLDNVRALEPYLRDRLAELYRIPLVGDVRGAGFFWAVELVRDRGTRERFAPADADWLLRDVLSNAMDRLGLLCRLDDRGEPVIQLSPPLVADRQLLDQMVTIVAEALDIATTALTTRK